MQETPETRAKLANAITTLRSQGREAEVSSLVSQYKAKYRPETLERSATAPESFLQGAAKTYKTLENAGQGVALSVGNLGTGVLAGVANLANNAGIPGAKTLDRTVENFRQIGFVQPTMESQKTFAGKAGKVVTDVLPYMIPVGGLAANVGKDALVGFGQSGGNVGSGVASGVVTGFTGGASKIPGFNKVVSKIPLNKTARGIINTLAPGYTSDVVQGLAGERGEDRMGAAALLPGAGTVFSGVLGAGVKGAKTVQKMRDPQTYIDATAKSWDVPKNSKNAKFDKAKIIDEQASAKGFNIKQELAQDNVFKDKNITDGKFDLTDTIKSYREKAGGGSEYLDTAIKLKNPAVLREPSADIYNEAIKSIDPTTTKGDSIIKYLRKEASLQKDKLDFSDIYNKKKYYGSNANWNGKGDGIAEEANAALNIIFKKKLIEKGKEAGIPVEKFLAMQEQNYKIADYLEALDGARVPMTPIQKTRRGVLKVAGALLGSKGGPYGAVAGYHGAGLLDNILGDLPKPVRDAVMKDYVKATPQVQKQMIEIIQESIAQNKAMKALPPRSPLGSSANPIITSAPQYTDVGVSANDEYFAQLNNQLQQKRLRLPPPSIQTPLNPNQTYTGNYSAADLAKIRQDNGGYLPLLKKSSVARPTIMPNKAVSKKATIKVKLPRKTK
jgi:hypothetical protein